MTSAPETTVLLGLGGNLPSAAGGPLETQIAACEKLAEAGLLLEAVSAVYRTRPVPPSGQPDFINIAVRARTSLDAEALLRLCLETETALGRKRAERWSARTLDIDLLAYGDVVLPGLAAWRAVVGHPEPSHILLEPVVPHPRLHRRAFVLAPLADIAPAWRHPVLGQTIREMLEDLPSAEHEGITRLSDAFGRFSSLQPGNGAV